MNGHLNADHLLSEGNLYIPVDGDVISALVMDRNIDCVSMMNV
jgi:hypothetical protein